MPRIILALLLLSGCLCAAEPLTELRVICRDAEPAFSAEAIAAALRRYPPVFLAGHPMGSRQELRDAVDAALELGFRRHGHLAAEHEVGWTEEGLLAEVAIGPAYRWAEVVVEGLSPDENAHLRTALLATDEAQADAPIRIGAPARGDQRYLDAAVGDRIRDTCSETFARYPTAVSVSAEAGSDGEATLRVVVADPHGPRRFAGLRIAGASDPAAVRAALAEAVPELATAELAHDHLRRAAEALLADSGRALATDCRWEPAEDPDGGWHLLAELEEHPRLPAYGTAYSHLHRELLRFHRRLASLDRAGRLRLEVVPPFALGFSADASAFELAIDEGPHRRALRIAASSRVLDFAQRRYLPLPEELGATASFRLPIEVDTDRRRWSFRFNVAWLPDPAPQRHSLDIWIPAAALLLEAEELVWDDGVIRDDGTTDSRAVIHPEGPLLLELTRPEEATSLRLIACEDQPPHPDLGDWELAAGDLRERFYADVLARSLGFFLDARAAEASRPWALALQGWWNEESGDAPDGPPFVIPVHYPEHLRNRGLLSVLAVSGPILHRALVTRTENDGWPARLLREYVHLGWGDNRHFRATLIDLHETASLGPLGCATLILTQPPPEWQRWAAVVGLRACTLEDFRRDLTTLGFDAASIQALLVHLADHDLDAATALIDEQARADLIATVHAIAADEFEAAFAVENFTRTLWQGGVEAGLRHWFAAVAGIDLGEVR